MQAHVNETESTQKFEVALLIESLEEGREISDALRELGIYAHYYGDLDEFWVAANTETPDFLIIDVKKMSQGATLFKNHPKVKNGSMKFAFYYSEATKVLVNSTFQFNHYGLIQKEINLVGQLKGALRRRNEELHLESETEKLQERILRLQRRSNRILQDSQDNFNFQNQFSTLVEVTNRIGKPTSRKDYLNNLMSVLSEWEDCKAYGVYTLNQTNQKLVAPRTIKPGYEALPELWLTRPAEEGIDAYAQEMACEVAFDVFDNDARAINIIGTRNNPEIIVIAKFNEEALTGFPWELFEERLSSSFARMSFAKTAPDKSTHMINLYEGFSYLDDVHFHQANGEHKLADVDFSRLIQVVKEKRGNRFYWKAFNVDFTARLEETLSGDFKMANYGAQSFLIFIDKKHLEADYQKLKAMVEDFEYWRYFQDTSMVMTQRMYPELRLLAPSSLNYIRHVHSNILSAGQSQLESRPTNLGQNFLDA